MKVGNPQIKPVFVFCVLSSTRSTKFSASPEGMTLAVTLPRKFQTRGSADRMRTTKRGRTPRVVAGRRRCPRSAQDPLWRPEPLTRHFSRPAAGRRSRGDPRGATPDDHSPKNQADARSDKPGTYRPCEKWEPRSRRADQPRVCQACRKPRPTSRGKLLRASTMTQCSRRTLANYSYAQNRHATLGYVLVTIQSNPAGHAGRLTQPPQRRGKEATTVM